VSDRPGFEPRRPRRVTRKPPPRGPPPARSTPPPAPRRPATRSTTTRRARPAPKRARSRGRDPTRPSHRYFRQRAAAIARHAFGLAFSRYYLNPPWPRGSALLEQAMAGPPRTVGQTPADYHCTMPLTLSQTVRPTGGTIRWIMTKICAGGETKLLVCDVWCWLWRFVFSFGCCFFVCFYVLFGLFCFCCFFLFFFPVPGPRTDDWAGYVKWPVEFGCPS